MPNCLKGHSPCGGAAGAGGDLGRLKEGERLAYAAPVHSPGWRFGPGRSVIQHNLALGGGSAGRPTRPWPPPAGGWY